MRRTGDMAKAVCVLPRAIINVRRTSPSQIAKTNRAARCASLGSGDWPPVRLAFLPMDADESELGSSGHRGWARCGDNRGLGVFVECKQNQAIHRNLGKVRAGSA